jgi:hypothetical protein
VSKLIRNGLYTLSELYFLAMAINLFLTGRRILQCNNIIKSNCISACFMNRYAYFYYAIKSWSKYCFLQMISQSMKRSNKFLRTIYLTLDDFARFLFVSAFQFGIIYVATITTCGLGSSCEQTFFEQYGFILKLYETFFYLVWLLICILSYPCIRYSLECKFTLKVYLLTNIDQIVEKLMKLSASNLQQTSEIDQPEHSKLGNSDKQVELSHKP